MIRDGYTDEHCAALQYDSVVGLRLRSKVIEWPYRNYNHFNKTTTQHARHGKRTEEWFELTDHIEKNSMHADMLRTDYVAFKSPIRKALGRP